MKFRVKSAVSDLHVADARYQQECKTNFLHSSYLVRLAKTFEKDIDNALPCVIKFMKANEKEIWNSVEVHKIYYDKRGYKINRRNVANTLKDHFSDSLVVLSSPVVASILTFRKSCYFRLQHSNDIDDTDVKVFAERIKTETEKRDRTLYKIQFDSNTIC